MDTSFRERFAKQWKRFFPQTELPLACWYANELHGARFDAPKPSGKGYTCLYSQLAAVRRGRARAFNQDNLGCAGAIGNLGFLEERPPSHDEKAAEYIASVEQLRKTRGHALGMLASNPPITARGEYLVCKRWDMLQEEDAPEIVVFFCGADALSGLHALANYDIFDSHGVVSPSGAGCETLIGFAMKEFASDAPRAVLGSFDPPVRKCMKKDWLSFSIPWPRFVPMVENMDECFLGTHIWEGIRKRMGIK